ncbi:uncharacterized protein LOC141691544 [Apium graveolens]|uniref:uncharacterized protein LOC141691544 n=1 Tax=Apium graveolens TaxID=4045 RepID=UPI003D78CEEF
MELLASYEHASGQRINKNKSSVFFSANVIDYNRDLIFQEMQVHQADEFTKYLGLPNILGRNKFVILGYLKEKVKASIKSWNEKNISKPSKELLIKTVAQSLPTFAMNVFLLPLELIREVKRELSKFFLELL